MKYSFYFQVKRDYDETDDYSQKYYTTIEVDSYNRRRAQQEARKTLFQRDGLDGHRDYVIEVVRRVAASSGSLAMGLNVCETAWISGDTILNSRPE